MIKTFIAGTIFSGLFFSSIVAAVTLTAEQIKYTPNNQNFLATNAKEALNELYKISEYNIPEDTYFYEQGTEGDSSTIVRYRKINNEYFVCDQYGKIKENIAVDTTSKTLVPYVETSANKLHVGTAGYASNSLILGDSLGESIDNSSGITMSWYSVNTNGNFEVDSNAFYSEQGFTSMTGGNVSNSGDYGVFKILVSNNGSSYTQLMSLSVNKNSKTVGTVNLQKYKYVKFRVETASTHNKTVFSNLTLR